MSAAFFKGSLGDHTLYSAFATPKRLDAIEGAINSFGASSFFYDLKADLVFF
jgi:hypothetical protein